MEVLSTEPYRKGLLQRGPFKSPGGPPFVWNLSAKYNVEGEKLVWCSDIIVFYLCQEVLGRFLLVIIYTGATLRSRDTKIAWSIRKVHAYGFKTFEVEEMEMLSATGLVNCLAAFFSPNKCSTVETLDSIIGIVMPGVVTFELFLQGGKEDTHRNLLLFDTRISSSQKLGIWKRFDLISSYVVRLIRQVPLLAYTVSLGKDTLLQAERDRILLVTECCTCIAVMTYESDSLDPPHINLELNALF